MKNYVTLCIALVMACAVFGMSGDVSFAADETAPALSSDYVQAYYFHATRRCKTCTNLEQYSREAIQTNFEDALKSGKLRYAEINFDEPENRHYLQDYNLTYRALVLVRFKDGKQADFRNLEKIWQHVKDREVFLQYVKTEVDAYLKEL